MAKMMKETKQKIEQMRVRAQKFGGTWVSAADMKISIATAKRYPEIFSVEHMHVDCDDDGEEYTMSWYVVTMNPDFIKNGFGD